MTFRIERIRTMEQVAAFVEANEPVDFQPSERTGAYQAGASPARTPRNRQTEGWAAATSTTTAPGSAALRAAATGG